VIGLEHAGGWSGMRETIASLPDTEYHFSLLRPVDDAHYPWPAVLLGLGFVLGPAYWIGNQAIVQRTFGTKSQADARASYVLCAAIKTVFPFLLVVPGLIGLALFRERLGDPNIEPWNNANAVLPELVKLLPRGVLGIVLGAFLAGVMSNLDSYVNSASTLCVTDIYRPLIRPAASDHECLWVGRGFVVVFLLLGAVSSVSVREKFGSVFEAFQTFLSFIQGALLALLLLGMLSRRVTQWGGLAGLIVGVVTSAVMHSQGILFLWIAWWSFVAAILATLVVSLITKPFDEERLRGLVVSLPSESPNSPPSTKA
jgi:SSS family solute:Na+ symporter